MNSRTIKQSWLAMSARDGAGVNLKRALGSRQGQRLDPFLMLDNFSSDDPNDYIAGFPAHPHRGFETVTYIVDGHMKHRDHLGNEGDLKAGGVQWMTAGRGIIHEEMPQQKDGLLRGFQLWLNLPANEKMKPAHYEDIPAEKMPWQTLSNGHAIKMIAGSVSGLQLTADATRVTQPIIADVQIKAGQALELLLPEKHNALLYVFENSVELAGQTLTETTTAVLSHGTGLKLQSASDARILFIAGLPLNEPVAQYGPFVMNTEAELEQAVQDYRNGTLTA